MRRLRAIRALIGACCILGALPTQAQSTEPQYLVLPNQYIITFHDEVARTEALRLTRDFMSRHNLQLRHTYKESLTGFSAVIPAAAVERIRNHPLVASIEPNGYWYLEGSDPRLNTVDAPTNLTPVPNGDSQIDLTWNDNATTEVGTEVVRSTTGINGNYTRVAGLAGANITAYSDTNVVAGQEYCYQVRVGESQAVVGPFSVAACATIEVDPPLDPPAAPTTLVATTVDDQRIDINWADQADNEDGFRIERALGQGAAFAEIDLAGANQQNYADAGLNDNTEYCYRIRAFNAAGDSANSNVSCATTDETIPPTDPYAAPTNLSAGALGDTQMVLSWTDNATNELGFEVQRSTNGINGDYISLGGVNQPNATGFTDNGLTSGQEYCYRVRAGRSLAEVGPFSTPACETAGPPPVTDPPTAPTGLTASAANFQSINLSWTDTSAIETGFEVERGTAPAGPFVQIDVLGANAVAYQNNALDEQTQYCYRVRAFNANGNSAYSNTSCATTPEEPPVGSCTDTGNHDSLANLYGISITKANLNPTWQATQTAGCELTPELFGLDSGVDGDHPDLNVVEVLSFIAADPGDNGEDSNGHGTHTAGTAAAIDGNGGAVGVAPGARIHGFKVCGNDGSCALDDIIAGIDEVTARKLANPALPMVANMSLGGGGSVASDTAVRRSVNAGVTYAVSAGNGILGACIFPGDAANSSPARIGDDLINAANGSDGDTAQINGVITVTSSDINDADVNCNFGAPVTVAAPGDAIFSTWLDGGYNTISGTSMASPHVAGAAILYLHRNPTATPAEVEQAIVNDLDPWTTNDTPNASGRLDAQGL
ncbi:MAG: S8 family serine peptidase [Pseudomonadota bacterium]